MNLKYLSEWKDRVKELVVDRISGLKGKFKLPKCKFLNQPGVKDKDTQEKLHADFVLLYRDFSEGASYKYQQYSNIPHIRNTV